MKKHPVLAVSLFVLMVFLFRVPISLGQGAKSGWKAEWEKTLAAAKEEGKLAVVSGASSRDYIGFFRKAYPDIKVDFLQMRAPDLSVRIPTERRAGVFAWDIIFLGGSAGVVDFIPAGVFANLREALILPDLAKDETWVGDFDDIWVDNHKKKFKIHHKAASKWRK